MVFNFRMGKSNKERQKKFMQKVNSDPEKREKYLLKRRERYAKKKAVGGVKSIKDYARRDQKAIRKEWAERQKRHRAEKKIRQESLIKEQDDNFSTNMSPCSSISSRQYSSG